MKSILKPIFEMITGEYILFNNILYNYIAMTIIGIIAFKVAWNSVDRLYNLGIIIEKSSASLIHWIVRLCAFALTYYIFSLVVWVTKFIYTYRIIIFIVVLILIGIRIVFKGLKKIKK